jgi:hypothetical protein
MTTFSLRYEDRLEGPSNFVPWKCRVQMLLEEHDLWDLWRRRLYTSYRSFVGRI